MLNPKEYEMAQGLDPVVFATLSNRLDGIVRESMQACVQSARSSVIQARDLSVSIADSRLKLINMAQGHGSSVLESRPLCCAAIGRPVAAWKLSS